MWTDREHIEQINDLESFRLKALKDYQVLDTASDNEFDAITRLASYICKTPISLITLVDENRQWFKSKVGVEISETSRDIAFCKYTIQSDDLLEVTDADADIRFSKNPLVTQFPNIKSYTGAPLITPEGYRIGSLCVIDTKPNQLDEEQKDALRVLAGEVISHLEVRRKNFQLEEMLSKYRDIYTMFDTSGELHCILDNQARIQLINRSVTTILGYDPRQVAGKSIADFCFREDVANLNQILKNNLKRGNSNFDLETRVHTSSGELKWISWSVSVQKDKWFANGRDITYQRQVVSELEQLSLVASKINNGVVISNSVNTVVWVNDAVERITGYTADDLRGSRLADILKGEGTDLGVISKARESTRNKQSFTVDLLIYRKDGTPVWLSIMNSLILDANGDVEKEIEIITDITAKKEVEQKLDILSIAASKSSSGVVVRKNTGEILWMNEALEQILGYTLSELSGKTFGEMLIGEETDLALYQLARQAVADKRPYEIELKIYRKDRTPVWVFISNNPIFNDDGEVERQVGIMVDITHRKEAEEQLNLLSLVASKTENGVAISDAGGCVQWINDSYERLTGYGITELYGKRLGDVLKGPETDEAELERVRVLSRSHMPFEAELLNYRKDGEPVWYSISNTPIFGESGLLKQQVEIVSDISERKKAEHELIKNREEALQLSKAKETFLSVMSHELRTPLNAVIGMTHVLLADNLTESQVENMNILKFSAENLHSLINNVLDLTKIETNNLQLESVDISLQTLVVQTINSLKFKAVHKGVSLKYEIDPSLPEYVKGDSTRLYQILINLLGNSAKFTEAGEIKLKIQLLEQSHGNVKVGFVVSDTGIGIANDKISSIFEAYSQAEADTTRKYGGTGLGLAITKRLIELHNSEIIVASELGKGSSFTFAIDFKRTVTEAQPQKSNKYRSFTSNVLVVDDNDINLLLTKKVLAKWGITTDFAENGQIALDLVQKKRYDLVLMDIQMPVMGGLEATKTIREIDGSYFKSLPIIALTASMAESDLLDIGKSGMNDYVLKPFVPDALYEKINLYL